MRPDIKDPVGINADDKRVLCQACGKSIDASETIERGFYCEHCNHDLFDEDIL